MNNFEFEYPIGFILLLLIICIYKCPLSIKKYIFPHTHLFSNSITWINIQRLLYSLILSLLITALASPITYDQKTSSKRKGRDLVFALDTSGSMAEGGFDKDNPQKTKFEVLKELLHKFIVQRYDDNVGISIFGTFAYSAVPLTYDMKSINYLINFIDVGIAGDSTAIGEGIASASKILKQGDAKEKVIILITDGHQNSGAISIKEAVQKSSIIGIKIYTIGVGKDGDYDEAILKKISSDSNGKMFNAKNADMLQNVYEKIDALEPSKIRSQSYLNKHSLYIYPLSLAILLLLYLLLKSRKVPE